MYLFTCLVVKQLHEHELHRSFPNLLVIPYHSLPFEISFDYPPLACFLHASHIRGSIFMSIFQVAASLQSCPRCFAGSHFSLKLEIEWPHIVNLTIVCVHMSGNGIGRKYPFIVAILVRRASGVVSQGAVRM
jgi:hypothetical protein